MKGQYRGMTKTEYARRRRHAHLAAGLCKLCVAPQHGGTQMCWRHRLSQASWKAAKRTQAEAK